MHLLRPVVIAAAAALLLMGCGDHDDRPSVESWRPEWEAARAVVPEPETLVADGEEACGEALGELRAAREDLLETPRPVIDDSVNDWLSTAEGLLLDCPSDEEEVAERFQELEVLEAEVEAGLEASETG